jgi:hypothetical protein
MRIKEGATAPDRGERESMATLSAKEAALELGTDARTFRKFMRTITPKDEQPGQGNRYAIEARSMKGLRKKFDEWNKPKVKADPVETDDEVLDEELIDEVDELTEDDEDTDTEDDDTEDDPEEDEGPTDEELDTIESSDDFDLEDLEELV